MLSQVAGWCRKPFRTLPIDDVSLLTKRTAEGIYDITLVETTCMNMGHNADFDNAVKSANGKLSDPGVSSSPSTSEGPGIRESARSRSAY